MKRVLIIEDEYRAANQLKGLIDSLDVDFKILEVIDSIEDAVLWFNSHDDPDLIFMDIQLADGLSFEIFQKVKVESPIIFTTAFDQYAIKAFKVNSVDYLLKPIQQDELQAALLKFQKSESKGNLDPSVLSEILSGFQQPSVREGILVKDGNGYVQLKIRDLLYIYSENSLTMGVTSERRFIINETLDELFDTMDRHRFFKINRGQLVNRDAIEKIQPYLNHRLKLSLKNARDQTFVVSRQRTNDFKQWVNS